MKPLRGLGKKLLSAVLRRRRVGVALALAGLALAAAAWTLSVSSASRANAALLVVSGEAASSAPRWIGLTQPSSLKGPLVLSGRERADFDDVASPIETSLFLGPALALIIDDVGLAAAPTRAAIALPAEVTLSFLPYGVSAPSLAAEARRAGHEIMLHMPMEPIGRGNPGPQALFVGMPRATLGLRTKKALGRFDGLVGVNNHMGSRLTQNEQAVLGFLKPVAERGLIFVDSRTSDRSVAAGVSRSLGVQTAERDVFLDHLSQTRAQVEAQLRRAEEIARWRGTALAIGHPRPQTLAAIKAWWPGAKARGIRLVSLSDYMRLMDEGAPTLFVQAPAPKAY